MARVRGGALPLPLLAAVVLLAAAGASFLQCDHHLGSCEPEPGPGDEPVLSRLLPAAGSGGEVRGAARPADSRDDTGERRESDTARQRTPVATAAKQPTDPSSIVNRGQAATSEPTNNGKPEAQSGVSKDILKHRHAEDSSGQESPVAAAGLLKTSADNSATLVIPASVAQPSVPQQSNFTEKMPEGSSENQVKVLVEQRNVASKTERQPTVVPSGSKSRRKREVVSDVPDRAAAVPSGKSGIGAGQSKRLQTESPREHSVRAQKSASEVERKAVGKSVSSVPAGGKEGTSKPSTSTMETATPNVIKEAHKQNKRVTEKQDRHVGKVEHIHIPDVLKHDPQKASPAGSDSKVNANTVNKYQSVKSQKTANNGGSGPSEDAMPKKSTQSQSHGNGQKEVVKRFRSSEASHGARKAQKTHPVKSQDSHQQENLQGKARKSTGSAEGKYVSEAKSKTVAGPNKISSGVYKEKVKDPSSKLSNVHLGEHQTANNKVIAPMIRKTQNTLPKLKNNDTSQLNQDANMQNEKPRVRREIGDHSTFSVSEDSKLDTDHFAEMHLNETVKNATVKKVTFSNRSATVDDNYKTASTTIIVDGNLFRGSGSKTWKLSSTTNTSQNEVSREASVEGKSTKLPGSTFAESKNISSEKSNRSVISTGNRVNTTEIDKSKKLEDSREGSIAPSSYESGLKSASFSTTENTESDLQVKQAQAEPTNRSRDKSTDERENSADVPPEEQAPLSPPSRGETTLRIKRETAPEVKKEMREENLRDEIPPLVTDPITNINAENQSQEIETVSSESEKVKKLKEDDTKSTTALSKRMQSVKIEVTENATDSRSEQSTDEQQKDTGEKKNEESVSNDALHISDAEINSSESVVTVAAGLPNQKITKGEPVPQRLVSLQEKENRDEGGKSLTKSGATEESGTMKGEEEEVFSPVATERSEEPKGAHLPVISEGASSVSGADKPLVAKGTDKGTVDGEGEPQRGGPVAEAIQSQSSEDDTHSGAPLESEPRTQTGDSSAEAVAEKWVMPESSGRVEEAVQPQLLEDGEDSERLLVLADRLRQRDGGRRDAEEERGRDRERDRLDEPQLHFPSVPPGEDFHAAKLGLSDGIFLFGYLSTFISWLQPQDFPVELVRDALWNRISLTDLITETLQVEVGFIAVLSVGVALALAVPLTALGITCCRLVEARADAGRDHEPSACRRRSLLCGLWTVLLLMAVGVAAMFASNEQVSAAVQWSPRVLHTALSDTAAFVRSTHHQIGFVASKSLDQALAAAVEDLDSADALLGAPIQRELSRETGVDVALDALSDVSAAAEGASQRAAAVLEQAAQARGLALVARERLADLRYQLDAARRQCAARDRPLCDTVDAVGLDVSVRLEALLTDERLLALRDLRNGNLSAAAQQARADFQLLPRQVLESTRDARLGIRRELVRERAQLQESLSPLDAFSRSVSGRVDGARAAAQDAARVVAEADYWRWLVGLENVSSKARSGSRHGCPLCCRVGAVDAGAVAAAGGGRRLRLLRLAGEGATAAHHGGGDGERAVGGAVGGDAGGVRAGRARRGAGVPAALQRARLPAAVAPARPARRPLPRRRLLPQRRRLQRQPRRAAQGRAAGVRAGPAGVPGAAAAAAVRQRRGDGSRRPVGGRAPAGVAAARRPGRAARAHARPAGAARGHAAGRQRQPHAAPARAAGARHRQGPAGAGGPAAERVLAGGRPVVGFSPGDAGGAGQAAVVVPHLAAGTEEGGPGLPADGAGGGAVAAAEADEPVAVAPEDDPVLREQAGREHRERGGAALRGPPAVVPAAGAHPRAGAGGQTRGALQAALRRLPRGAPAALPARPRPAQRPVVLLGVVPGASGGGRPAKSAPGGRLPPARLLGVAAQLPQLRMAGRKELQGLLLNAAESQRPFQHSESIRDCGHSGQLEHTRGWTATTTRRLVTAPPSKAQLSCQPAYVETDLQSGVRRTS